MSTVSPTNVPGYFKVYTDLVSEKRLATAFTIQSQEIKYLFSSITDDQAGYAYAPGKWTIRELMQHLMDAERIFCYRALCFARKDTVILPSFDENEYAVNSFANTRSWQDLLEEFISLRKSTLHLFNSFTPGMLEMTGKAGANTLSVEQCGFIIIGHLAHHIKIIRDRYLSQPAGSLQ